MVVSNLTRILKAMKRLGNSFVNSFDGIPMPISPLTGVTQSSLPADMRSDEADLVQWVYLGRTLSGHEVFESFHDSGVLLIDEKVYRLVEEE